MAFQENKLKFKKLLAEAKGRQVLEMIEAIEKLLDEIGMPEFVIFESESVPRNDVYGRLKWYLMRRKPVTEVEKELLKSCQPNLNEIKLIENLIKEDERENRNS